MAEDRAFCPHCYARLIDGRKTCPKCGRNVSDATSTKPKPKASGSATIAVLGALVVIIAVAAWILLR